MKQPCLDRKLFSFYYSYKQQCQYTTHYFSYNISSTLLHLIIFIINSLCIYIYYTGYFVSIQITRSSNKNLSNTSLATILPSSDNAIWSSRSSNHPRCTSSSIDGRYILSIDTPNLSVN